MNCKFCLVIAAAAALSATFAFAQNTKDKSIADAKKKAAEIAGQHQPPADFPLPPGWTMEDMQKCMEAGTPGKMHEHLQKGVGVWSGKTTMWMAPGMEPMKSECTTTVTSIMDGRFTKCETSGEMPGMGPFNGFGIYGYDNVSKKFQSTWIDNCGTGMLQSTGELSSDGKTMTWTGTVQCPLTNKPCTFRTIEKYTGDNTMTMEMHGTDPKSGKEYKMLVIEYTRTGNGDTKTAVGTTTR